MQEGALAAVIALGVYNVAMIGIGVWAMRRAKSQADFLLGGHQLGPWLAGFAYVASTSSAWVLLGFSGFVYAAGAQALWMIPGILGGFALVWLWAGPRLSQQSRAEGHLTLMSFLSHGLGREERRLLAITAAALIVFCFTFYVASQFQGAGQAFESAIGVNRTAGVLIGAGVVLAYTFLGGFWAVSLTDTVQGALMALVAVALPVAAVIAAGGPVAIVAAIMTEAPPSYLSPVGGLDGVSFAALGLVLGLVSTGVASLGQPHNLNWIMALRDDDARRRGWIIALVWGAVVYTGMAALGFAARALFGAEAPAEGVFLALAETLFTPIVAGVVIAALLSAIMSTVDAQLLVTSGAITEDLGLARAAPRRAVWVSRLVVFGVCAGAVGLTLFLPESIFQRVLFAWSALGAAFGPLVAARVLGWRPGGLALWMAMIVGFGLTVAFYLLLDLPGDWDERIAPWLPALGILWASRNQRIEGTTP
jgi:sodium/proline symporter